ncbi:MAG: hypothetical protein ACK4V1_12755, partial [Burkholderiaceae bacterium]
MNERDALRGYRAANEVLDEAPRDDTRATILAAAARAVEAKPRAGDRILQRMAELDLDFTETGRQRGGDLGLDRRIVEPVDRGGIGGDLG